MSRAKTLINGAERFGVRHEDAGTRKLSRLTEWEPNEIEARARLAECRKKQRKCKFVRARSYRLAPLVELPAWEQRPTVVDGIDAIEDAWTTGLDPGISVRLDTNEDGLWIGEIFDYAEGRPEEVTGETIDEARAACEARLRELGYRVARPK